MSVAVDLKRRAFLSGRSSPVSKLRPPWSLADDQFLTICTQCDACAKACPEGIIRAGSGGFPVLDFNQGECTFCGECASQCEANAIVFDDHYQWPWQAEISAGCLNKKNVICRSCVDECETEAIRFKWIASGVSIPEIDNSLCSGCGACIGVCPEKSIVMEQKH